ncbi:MAG: FN3 associated domain-containing protein [Terracidiphilus sp.]
MSGSWHAAGKKEPIVTGDAIEPGSLLQPAEEAHEQSITILLPDGQRVLYECFNAQDCARGFRVPSLYREPDLNAIDLMARVGAVLLRDDRPTKPHEEPHVPRDESVAVLSPENKVKIAGLAAALSNDTYWYEVRPLSGNSSLQPRHAFEKSTRLITITLPSEGLFDVSIVDHLNTPRIDLLVVAFRQPRAAKVLKSFEVVQELLKEWNENYQGWPIHDFQRAFLRSVVLGVPPSSWHANRTARTLKEISHADVTAEPRFSPKPGVFHGDTEVTLQCDTDSATIHYTVDGSQPFTQSSTYHAPIMVKGTELTIKAFATANGKKDSPVVTGIFRIGD